MPDDPEDEEAPNSNEPQAPPRRMRFGLAQVDTLATRVAAALGRIDAVGHDADADYRNEVAKLRTEAAGATRALAVAYGGIAEDNYVNRWTVVRLMADLAHPEATAVFRQVLAAPMPVDRGTTCGGSNVSQESLVRATAVDGLRRLAMSGSGDATEGLRGAVHDPNPTVKVAAIRAYLAAGGPTARETLLRELPDDDHFWLDARALRGHEIPQPPAPEESSPRTGFPPVPE